MRRLLAVIGVAVLALSLGVARDVKPVLANSCNPNPYYPYCFDILYNTENRQIDRVMMDTQLHYLHTGNGHAFKNGLLLVVNGHSLEMGFCTSSDGSCPTIPVPAYGSEYVAVDGVFVWQSTVRADDSAHNFKFSSNNSNWYFYVDTTQVYVYNAGSASGNANTAQTGGVLDVGTGGGGPDSSEYTVGTFSNHVQEHYSGAWHNWSQYSWTVNQPCAGGVTTNCFNAQIPSQGVWNWNKVA